MATEDGEQFLALARRLLAEFDTALNHFEGYLAGTRGSVSIAALPSLAATMLPPVLAAFRSRRPEVSVAVRDGLSQEVLDHVVSGSVDMAVTVATVVPESLEATHIAVDRFVCVFPPSHRFASLTKIPWSELAGEPFVAFDPTSSIRSYVDRTLDERGARLGTVTEARNIGAVAGLTASGLGVSVVPGLVLPMLGFASLENRPLVEPAVERDICLIQDPDRPMSRDGQGAHDPSGHRAIQDLHLPPGVRWV